MATDVEVSPKETIMDLMKASPASCNSSKKGKGIRDFFSATPKTFVSQSNGIVDESGKKSHFELVCETELKINKNKDCDIVRESKEHREKKEKVPDDTGNQNGLKAALSDSSGNLLETQMPKGGKKRCLSTKNKSKETKSIPANDEIAAEKVLKDDEEKEKPQEMDYGEFLKSLAQNGDNQAVDYNDKKEQSSVPLSSSDKLHGDKNTPKNSVHEDKNTPENSVTTAQSSTNTATDSLPAKPERIRAKATPNKRANAFSVLMQARAKTKSTEDDSMQDKEPEEIDSAESANVSEIRDTDSDKPEECPVEKNPTPSVLNFFTKTARSTKNNNDTKISVVVEADIHSDPSNQKITPVKRKTNNTVLKKSGKIVKSNVDDNDIVFLGSEVIELEANECEVTKSEPKRKDSKAKSTSSEKLETNHKKIGDTEEKSSKPVDSVSNEKRKSFLKDSSPLDQSVKTAQATLQFGQGGKLAMNTSVIAKAKQKSSKKDHEKNEDNDLDANKKSAKSQKNIEDSGETSRPVRNTRLRMRKKPEIMVNDSDDENVDVSQNEPECKAVEERTKKKPTNIRQKKSLTSIRKSSGTESGTASDKDFTTTSKKVKAKNACRSRAKELLMKAKQTKQDICPKNAKQQKRKSKTLVASPKEPTNAEKPASQELSSPDVGCRRQSRRIAHQQKVKQEEAEKEKYISVDTESDSSEASTPKRKNKLNRARKRSSSSSPRKPAKKLAPIFTLKSKEAANSTPPQPPEDPEVVRRRREFLLSGVPSELKRQAATVTTVVASDFAPFPEHSHVQQKIHGDTENLDVWSLKSPEKINGLLKNEPVFAEAESAARDWKSLRWSPVISEETKGFKTLDPVTGSISGEVQEHLLKDLQQTNPAFPFTALCDKFRERLSAAKDECTISSGSVGKKTDDDMDMVIIDESEELAAALGDRDSQWPETLQPKCTTEIIGNKGCLRRLKYWLEEWKTVIQKEAKLSARSSAAKDSDFDFSDSEEEQSQLCNTMLLVGPHGVGKTAAVYALAQQLSYKVFEVNASSSRQGRHILAQLQEATQSHQVAQKKDGVILSPPPAALSHCSESREKPVEKTSKKKTGVPNAFANFFKKTETATDTKTATKGSKIDTTNKSKDYPNKNAKKGKTSDSDSSRKRKRETDDVEVVEDVATPKRKRNEKKKAQSTAPEETKSGEESNLAGCLNLTSTSLILFDEVDLVFEEDTGFLQTVQHFITTTKIPIIMTTSDPGFQRQLSARVETLVFTSPPLMSVASYLQTVGLAMGIRTCSKDLNALARLCKGDVRHALLTLQFLVLSGGGRLKEQRPVKLKSEEKSTPLLKNEEKPQSTFAVNQRSCDGGSDSDGDFVCLKPLRKKPRRIFDEEDGSLPAVTSSMDVQTASRGDEADSRLLIAADQLPPVHLQLHESVLAMSDNLHDLFVTGIKNEYNTSLLLKLVEECLKLKANKADFIETSLLHLLPLPKTSPPARWRPPVTEKKGQKATKRKRIRSDIFDSEASDDDDIMKKSNIKKDDLKHAEEVASSVESGVAVDFEDCSKTSAETPAACATGEITNGGLKTEVKEEESKAMEEGDSSLRVQGTETNDSPTASDKQSSERPRLSLKGSKPSTDHGLASKLLSSFATYYESMSVVDIIASKLDTKPLSLRHTCILPGIDDCCSKAEGSCDRWREEAAVEIEVHASRKLFQNITTCMSSWKEDGCSDHIPEVCSLPISFSSQSSNSDIGDTSSETSVPESYKSVATSVMDNLPPHTSSEAIMLDYLPTLRCISQAEHCRQIAKTKRRFHHHFDSIGLCLGQSTLTGLRAEFPSVQQDV